MNLETIKGNAPFTAKEAGYQEERLEVLDAHFRRMLEKEEILCAGYAMSRNGKMFVNNALGDLDSTDRGTKAGSVTPVKTMGAMNAGSA